VQFPRWTEELSRVSVLSTVDRHTRPLFVDAGGVCLELSVCLSVADDDEWPARASLSCGSWAGEARVAADADVISTSRCDGARCVGGGVASLHARSLAPIPVACDAAAAAPCCGDV